jgi:hypothetical protein
MSCRRIFKNTLKTVAVGNSNGPYDACPYCLTEISADAETVSETTLPKIEVPPQKDASKQDETFKAPPECKNHFGYLGQRAGKGIPDECLTCSVIVQCMLNHAKEQVGSS